MRIVYIGLKEVKGDNVAATGLTWARGQVHEVEDEGKAKKLLEHPLVWRNADEPYDLINKPEVVTPAPRISVIPTDSKSMFWEPVVVPVPEQVFLDVQSQKIIPVFMTPEDADLFADWKLGIAQLPDTSPKETGPRADKPTKAKAA